MITYLKGRLAEKKPAYAVIECNGVGYYLNISLHTYSKIGNEENCKLFTYLSVIQNPRSGETVQNLYGFATEDERALFKLLITVSGISASKAIGILTALSPNEVQQAIVSGDVDTLKTVKGLGPKQAQKVIVELKDKLDREDLIVDIVPSKDNTKKKEALSALITLGFDKKSAEKALDKAIKQQGDIENVEQLIKLGLKLM